MAAVTGVDTAGCEWIQIGGKGLPFKPGFHSGKINHDFFPRVSDNSQFGILTLPETNRQFAHENHHLSLVKCHQN